jgi:AraC-like DNA-binding protein
VLETLQRTTIIGDKTVHQAVQAPAAPPAVWLNDAPVCPSLTQYGIIHLGVVEAFEPYRFVRPQAIASELIACCSGRGRVLIDGDWADCTPGTAVIMPQYSAIGYYACGGEPWKLVWVCYKTPNDHPPLFGPSSPAFASYDPMPLLHAVEGLRHESSSARDAACMEYWTALVHRLVLRFAHRWQSTGRLHHFWEKVAELLDQEWTLDRLAAAAGCCAETLRQQCQQQLGRSPMQQLTFLRVQRSANLLILTDHKIEFIASQVGYADSFAFSAMFKKWMGCSPKAFRDDRRQNPKPSAEDRASADILPVWRTA